MRTLAASSAVALLVGLFLWSREPAAQDPAPPTATPPKGPESRAPGERFDKLVREDMFAGFGGDEAALLRGLATCDAALQDKPDHAEALVWRGAARIFRSADLFGKGSFITGLKLWNSGLEDMDRAVQLEPSNPGVRIPRAAVLMPAARNAPKAMGRPLLDRALDDYLTMTRLQADKIARLGEHPWGELRMGLADVYRQRGDLPNSKRQLELVRAERPETEYAKRAAEWLGAPDDARLVHGCIGCHGQ